MSEAVDTPATIWTDRFIKRELLPAGELARRFNILNPRSHPEAQRDATESSLDTVGWIDEISLSTNGDGPASLADNPDAVMFDGHERVELGLVRGGEAALLPVKWYQLTPKETDFALLVKDPTTEMAETKPKELAALLERTRTMTVDPRLGAMLQARKLRAGMNGQAIDPMAEWRGMPEFNQEDKTAFKSIHVHFKNQDNVDNFAELVGQKIGEYTRAIWYPEIEIERYADKRYTSES